ncbi:MAG: hypothetical protein AB8H12_03015 [Lewinella sp.]
MRVAKRMVVRAIAYEPPDRLCPGFAGASSGPTASGFTLLFTDLILHLRPRQKRMRA